MVQPVGPMDKEDAVEVARYLAERVGGPVGLDVWTRQESGLVRTDRDTCTHCQDVLELGRQLHSLHPAINVTSYDFEKHASRAEETGITLAPTTIVRGHGRSIRFVGLFSGLLFPALLDVISFVSMGATPLSEERRVALAELPEVEVEAMLAPYDPYSAHMARLLGAFAVEAPKMRLQLTEMAELPVLAGQRALTEVPVTSINGRRFSGAWDDEPLLQQIQRVIEGSGEAVIRDRVLATPFLTEEQAIQRAREEMERERAGGGLTPPGAPGGLGGPGPGNEPPGGGLIVPGR